MNYDRINSYLVDIFNKVIIIEENTLKNSQFKDATLKEMHTVDIIGTHKEMTPSEIAQSLLLTLGTVTTSLNKLEDKGYVQRVRSNTDRRVVHVSLTEKGYELYNHHQQFHKDMVMTIIDGMSSNQVQALGEGLIKLHRFLEELM